jgi:hypothetical protein
MAAKTGLIAPLAAVALGLADCGGGADADAAAAGPTP